MLEPSLCHACAFMRTVTGRLGQTYFRCTSEAVPLKYPPQPVRACEAYAAKPGSGPPARP